MKKIFPGIAIAAFGAATTGAYAQDGFYKVTACTSDKDISISANVTVGDSDPAIDRDATQKVLDQLTEDIMGSFNRETFHDHILYGVSNSSAIEAYVRLLADSKLKGKTGIDDVRLFSGCPK
ncbi:MAG: hypothetical protein HY370_05460 [Proteobacteria bacterium]|nr:hypothetical protein [Pseudomonadota bacterium]